MLFSMQCSEFRMGIKIIYFILLTPILSNKHICIFVQMHLFNQFLAVEFLGQIEYVRFKLRIYSEVAFQKCSTKLYTHQWHELFKGHVVPWPGGSVG